MIGPIEIENRGLISLFLSHGTFCFDTWNIINPLPVRGYFSTLISYCRAGYIDKGRLKALIDMEYVYGTYNVYILCVCVCAT